MCVAAGGVLNLVLNPAGWDQSGSSSNILLMDPNLGPLQDNGGPTPTHALPAGSGEGEPSRVRVFLGANLLANAAPVADQELDPFGAILADGVFVG
jgi:hypothetical protein